MIPAIIVVYGICTIILFILGQVWLTDRWLRRLGAWAVLTCWAWPLWAIAGLVTGVCRLFLIAIGKDD